MADIFISYSHEDVALAEKIEAEILRWSKMTIWRDHRIAPGTKFEGEIQNELRQARICLVLMSGASLASQYCQNEVGFADANGTPIVPIRLDDCRPAGFLESRSYLDFSEGPRGRPPLYGIVVALRDRIRILRQNDLRDDYLEMYRHLQSRLPDGAGDPVLAVVVAVEIPRADDWGPPPEPHYSRSVHHVSPTAAREYCASVIDHLERGEPCLSVLPFRYAFSHLPAWFFRRADLDRGNGARFALLPDAVLLTGSFDEFDDGVLFDASVFAPTPRTEAPVKHPVAPPVDVEYAGVGYHVAADLQWIGEGAAENLYAFILSKGVYRVECARVEHYGQSRLTLTKYLNMPSARLRLFAGSRDAAHRPPTETLQLTYLRYADRFARGGSMQFLLFNDREGIAVVSAMRAIVHEVTPRPPQRPRAPGAAMREYRYTVVLAPVNGEVTVTEDKFKYGAGDVDAFTIEFESSDPGYDYVVSVEVTWYDLQTGASHTLSTPRETIPFPLYDDALVEE